MFWLLNALNKVYTTDISHPVVFIIDESQAAFASTPPATLCLEVTGSGWSLLMYRLSCNVHPLELSIAQVLAREGEIRSEHLLPILAEKTKAVKVRNVWMDKAIGVRLLPQGSPTD